MKKIIYSLLTLLLLIAACECKDDEFDPCEVEGIAPIRATFTTAHDLGFQDSIRRIVSDTFVTGRRIIFSATQSGLTYHWTVGSDARVFEEQEFSLRFDNVEGQDIPIQLIVEGEPDLDCFPADDGRDTLTKNIHFVGLGEAPIFGQFRGVVASMPNDTFTIDIQSIPPDADTNLSNLPNGCIRPDNNRVGFQLTYRDFYLVHLINDIECPEPQGWGRVESDGSISIYYRIYDPSIDLIVRDTFRGQKIQ